MGPRAYRHGARGNRHDPVPRKPLRTQGLPDARPLGDGFWTSAARRAARKPGRGCAASRNRIFTLTATALLRIAGRPDEQNGGVQRWMDYEPYGTFFKIRFWA